MGRPLAGATGGNCGENLQRTRWLDHRRIAIPAQSVAAPNIHIEADGHSYSVTHTLVKRQLDVRLSAACARTLTVGTASYKSIASILEKGLDRRRLPEGEQTLLPLEHASLRGSEYYH